MRCGRSERSKVLPRLKVQKRFVFQLAGNQQRIFAFMDPLAGPHDEKQVHTPGSQSQDWVVTKEQNQLATGSVNCVCQCFN